MPDAACWTVVRPRRPENVSVGEAQQGMLSKLKLGSCRRPWPMRRPMHHLCLERIARKKEQTEHGGGGSRPIGRQVHGVGRGYPMALVVHPPQHPCRKGEESVRRG